MELTFDDFKRRAKDNSLSIWEKIGFPDEYRKNTEQLIFGDIFEKCKLGKDNVENILDIGCGCSGLVYHLIWYAGANNKKLFLLDSEEMLSNIDISNKNVTKIKGCFPFIADLNEKRNFFDAIIVYSVIQYPFLEQSIFQFIHTCVDLLKPGGCILIGDIPNISARERFMSSEKGKDFKDNKESSNSQMQFRHKKSERIDDAIIIAIMTRYRNFGCETYLLPQKEGLPFANRREDLLIIKR